MVLTTFELLVEEI